MSAAASARIKRGMIRYLQVRLPCRLHFIATVSIHRGNREYTAQAHHAHMAAQLHLSVDDLLCRFGFAVSLTSTGFLSSNFRVWEGVLVPCAAPEGSAIWYWKMTNDSLNLTS